MKTKIFNIVFSLLLSVAATSQIVPFIYYPDSEVTLSYFGGAFGYSQYGPTPAHKAYYPFCNTFTNFDFQVTFINPNVDRDVKYFVEVYRVPFSTVNGTPQYTSSPPASIKVYTSSESVSSNYTLYHYVSLNIEPNNYYYAEISYKKKIGKNLYQASWHELYTNNLNFVNGTSNTSASGSINTVSNVTKPSLYGNTSVGQICVSQPTILNASATTCEDRYGVEVQEFDLMTWTGVGVNKTTNWVMGQAGNIDIGTLYGEFTYGKIYKVRLFAGLTWSTQDFFITPAAPTVTASVNKTSTRQVVINIFGGGQYYYSINKIQNCDAVYLTTGTTCSKNYKIDIDKLDGGFAPIAHIASTGWVSTPPPASYDISYLSGYTMQGAGLYRITYSTGDPLIVRTIYLEFDACIRSLVVDNENLASMDELMPLDISVYPNPSAGMFNVRFNVPVSGVVNVYDMVGKNVNQLHLNKESSDYSFDLSGHAKGMYILDGMINGNKYTRKIILE